jgi:hypothetical protein
MIAHVVPFIMSAAVAVGAIYASLAVALRPRRGHGISILIPFRCPDIANPRVRNVEWLKRYWAAQLPAAEIIIGDDPSANLLFSKSVAVNNAAARAKGDVFVIVDADGYIAADAVLYCAEEIRHARKIRQRLWFVPYRQFYRLTQKASDILLQSSPVSPHKFPTPLQQEYILNDTDPMIGHWYGAMIQIMPREAFEIVGGWDERFRGWGGEDHAAMRATDTLYWNHKTLPGQVLHVWHPQLSPSGEKVLVNWKERMWENQSGPQINSKLSHRYYAAQGKPVLMRELVDESKDLSSKASGTSKNETVHRTSM